MGKSYNLSSSSDMRRFRSDLDKQIMSAVTDGLGQLEVEIDCPSCGKKITVTSGVNTCNYCGQQFNFDFELS